MNEPITTPLAGRLYFIVADLILFSSFGFLFYAFTLERRAEYTASRFFRDISKGNFGNGDTPFFLLILILGLWALSTVKVRGLKGSAPTRKPRYVALLILTAGTVFAVLQTGAGDTGIMILGVGLICLVQSLFFLLAKRAHKKSTDIMQG